MRAANTALGKTVIEEGIKQTPATWNTGVERIKNNKIKSALESDSENYAVEKVQGQLYNWQNALKNIKLLDRIGHKRYQWSRSKWHFVGVFPANHINRFIDYQTMISEKRVIILS